MSYHKERRYVLNMLENGRIDPREATTLLDALTASPPRRRTLRRQSPNKVIFEIDADQENLRSVLDKLNQAVHRTS